MYADLAPGEGLTQHRVALPDGRAVRAVTAGAGEVTVVFEAGLSGAASSWLPVQRAVATSARTVAYDRSGLGGSDADPRPRRLDQMATDLADVLAALAVTGPTIMVGHSWGGPIVRAYAANRADTVAAVVYVDATASPFMGPRPAHRAVRGYEVLDVLSRVRLHGLLLRLLLSSASRDLDPDDRKVMMRDALDPRAVSTGKAEARGIVPSLALLRALESAPAPVADVVAICGGRMARGDRTVRRRVLDHWTAEMRRAPRGRLVVADKSGHLVPHEQPDLVAAEIVRLVERVQDTS